MDDAMTPRQVCPKPCRECPFKRTAWPGYLGADTPTGFVHKTESGVPMPCHLTVDYETPGWEERANDAPLCAGSITFLANSCKLPYLPSPEIPVPDFLRRDIPQVLAALDDATPDHDAVFSNRQEFIDHHERGRLT